MGVGTGPEPVHAEMTSGSSGTIRSVATDTTEAMATVRESIELIRCRPPARGSPTPRAASTRRSGGCRGSTCPVVPGCRAPGTGALVSTVDTYVDTTATWIEESRLSSDTTASGLIAAANDYEDADSRSDGLFGFLQRFVS